MVELRLVVKPTAGGEKFVVQVDSAATVLGLKEAVAGASDAPAPQQRLIYKGQVLKDERTVESYGLDTDHVIHLVKARAQGSGPSAPAQSQAAPAAVPAATPQSATPAAPFGDAGAGLFNPFGMPNANPQQMSDYVSQMMNSPIMQSLLNNPDVMRAMFQQNPAIRDLMERNPEFAHLLNNPQMLRESMQLAANPALMREQMRNADRAMSNLESHPEGFNVLRRMYENIQEPLMNAATHPEAAGLTPPAGEAAANPFAALFNLPGAGGAAAGAAGAAATQPPVTAAGSAPAASGAPNTQPLPNPWAPSAPATGGPPPGASLGLGGTGLRPEGGGAPGLGALPDLGALPGGASMMPRPQDMGAVLAAMRNPAFQQYMQALAAQPGAIDMLARANPHLGTLMDSDPRLREALNNPELLRRMMDPNTMQQVMQLQQALGPAAMAGLGGGLGSGLGEWPLGNTGAGAPTGFTGGAAAGRTAAGAPAAPGAAGPGMPDLNVLMSMLGGGGAAAGAPVADPQQAFATQLEQLRAMGFFDQQANIRALQTTGGDVSAALDLLFQGI